ncbi:MAG TPA: hypothetical protein VGM84_12680 [Steroidobacteraceae bacterium]|jgi:hypothetical protein
MGFRLMGPQGLGQGLHSGARDASARFAARAALVLLLVGAGACHHLTKLTGGGCNDVKPKPYQTAKGVAPLQIPSGMDAPETGSALKIPRLNEPAPPKRGEKDPCLDEPPAFSTPKKPTPQARSIIRGPSGEAVPG